MKAQAPFGWMLPVAIGMIGTIGWAAVTRDEVLDSARAKIAVVVGK
jgi:hypothetical protein